MSFIFKESHIRRLCELNYFPVPDDGMILFGLRGCLPADVDGCEFDKEHTLVLKDVNYTNPRCTLGQWLPQKGTIALFPASTVPHRSYIRISHTKNGLGANQLVTGYYGDYRKGLHKPGSITAHNAFRQTEGRPVRRSADDYDYENDDRIEFTNPYDNLHAAWCQGINSSNFAGAGCQVVVGFPKCAKPNYKDNVGPWKVFNENAYKLAQTSFPYILLNGTDAERIAINDGKKLPVRLRFGSKGKLVTKLQEALKKEKFYEGILDDSFKERTWRAVINYQTFRFGPLEDDGVVGPNTATTLGMNWEER